MIQSAASIASRKTSMDIGRAAGLPWTLVFLGAAVTADWVTACSFSMKLVNKKNGPDRAETCISIEFGCQDGWIRDNLALILIRVFPAGSVWQKSDVFSGILKTGNLHSLCFDARIMNLCNLQFIEDNLCIFF